MKGQSRTSGPRQSHHSHAGFGFIVGTPEIRALIEETRRVTDEMADLASRVEARRPAFARLLAADGWLPEEYAHPDDGRDPARATLCVAAERTVGPGGFYTLLPPDGDIHYVRTVSETPSVSIHLLANDTACVWRYKFDPNAGTVTMFRSGYSNVKCLDASNGKPRAAQ
jgi:predicted metal-dependent enzyme (double-stranded beta helix superfamily)